MILALTTVEDWDPSTIIGIIQIVLALAACLIAWFIPKRIMWQQAYSALISDYRSYDFAAAVQGIVEFFAIDCDSNPDKINEAYKKRFLKDIYCEGIVQAGSEITEKDLDGIKTLKQLKEKLDEIKNSGELKNNNPVLNQKTPELCLHFQRRLLAQFYYQLDLCAHSPFVGKRRVHCDFTKGDANLVRIVFLMNQAIDESDILKKDISCDFRIPSARRLKGLNASLGDIYSVLRKSKPWMEV